MFKFITLSLLLSTNISANNWPTINLSKYYKQNSAVARAISITKDPVYKRQKNYLAYPLSEVITQLKQASDKALINPLLVFTAADGYKVTMAYQDAQTENGFIAFQDLAASKGNWVEFDFGTQRITPGPYYLLWPKPTIDKWRYPSPFQLTSISLQSADSYFLEAAPKKSDAIANQGFILFSRYCIRCHSVNNTGGTLGPELHLPQNVTELYSKKTLMNLILDAPASRPNTQMPVYRGILSESNVLKIQHYLHSLKTRK